MTKRWTLGFVALAFALSLLPGLASPAHAKKNKKEAPVYKTEPVVPVKPTWGACAVKLLIDKKEIYPAALAMMRSAESSILLNIYLFGNDANEEAVRQGEEPAGYVGIGKAMLDVMAAKLAAARASGKPFVVRLLTPDPGDGAEKQAEFKRRVTAFRNKVRDLVGKDDLPPGVEPPYHPSYADAKARGIPTLASNVEVMAHPDGGSWKLDHSKILLVDGKEALIGGMNFAECVASNHDAMIQVAGPVVQELSALFANHWYYAVQQAEALGQPVPADFKDYQALARVDEGVMTAQLRKRLAEGWPSGELLLTVTEPFLRTSREQTVSSIDSTVPGDQIMVEMLLMTDKACIDALLRAHERGVSVRVILDPNHSLYGFNCMGAPNVLATKPFLAASLPVRNFTPKDKGQELHLKMMLIKRASGAHEFAIGSTNWTNGAFYSNYELFVFGRSCPAVGERLEQMFEEDWGTRTHLPGRPIHERGGFNQNYAPGEQERELQLIQKIAEHFLENIHAKWF